MNDKLKIQEQEVEKASWIPIDEASEYLNDYYKEAYEKFLARTRKF